MLQQPPVGLRTLVVSGSGKAPREMENETKSACLPNRFDITETKFVDLTEMLVIGSRQIVVRIEKPVWLLAKTDPAGREIVKFTLPYSVSGLLGPVRSRVEADKPRSRRVDTGRVEEEPDALGLLLIKKLLGAFKLIGRSIL